MSCTKQLKFINCLKFTPPPVVTSKVYQQTFFFGNRMRSEMGSLRGAATQLILAYRKCGGRAAHAEHQADTLTKQLTVCRYNKLSHLIKPS